MKSAFCAASQPGYSRNPASSVIHTAATEAAMPTTTTPHSHRQLSVERHVKGWAATRRRGAPSSCTLDVVLVAIGPDDTPRLRRRRLRESCCHGAGGPG